MLEIIPSQTLKIIPWPKGENLIDLKRTKNRILSMGLEHYLSCGCFNTAAGRKIGVQVLLGDFFYLLSA
jgi:hypothetical protein